MWHIVFYSIATWENHHQMSIEVNLNECLDETQRLLSRSKIEKSKLWFGKIVKLQLKKNTDKTFNIFSVWNEITWRWIIYKKGWLNLLLRIFLLLKSCYGFKCKYISITGSDCNDLIRENEPVTVIEGNKYTFDSSVLVSMLAWCKRLTKEHWIQVLDAICVGSFKQKLPDLERRQHFWRKPFAHFLTPPTLPRCSTLKNPDSVEATQTGSQDTFLTSEMTLPITFDGSRFQSPNVRTTHSLLDSLGT